MGYAVQRDAGETFLKLATESIMNKRTRSECMQMVGVIRGLQDILLEDSVKPLDAVCAHIRSLSRAKMIVPRLAEIAAMLEDLAPEHSQPLSGKGQ